MVQFLPEAKDFWVSLNQIDENLNFKIMKRMTREMADKAAEELANVAFDKKLEKLLKWNQKRKYLK